MNAMRLEKLALQLHIGWLRLGWIWGVSIALLLLGVSSWMCLVVRGWDDAATLHEAQNLPVSVASNAPLSVSASEQNLSKFYALLGQRSEAESALQQVFAIAQKNELSLEMGEYQWQLDAPSHTARYQLILPVKGSYQTVRQFCAEVLQALPFAALDEMTFRRETASDEVLEASLSFTLYLSDMPNVPEGKP